MDLLNDLEELLKRLGVPAPAWLITVVVVLLLAGLAGPVLAPITALIRYGVTLVKWLLTRRYSSERRRQRQRAKFAKHLDRQLDNLELQEEWRDDKFAELEAEVEIERTWRSRVLRRLLPLPGVSPRRVRSLSKALAGGSEQLVLVEGEPGAGKSVALRHLAHRLARRAERSGNPRRVVPLYLNLKAMDIPPDEVSADRIRQFVLDTLTEVNNRYVQEMLDEEFDRGLDDGTWLFLFDSFDEIPDILSALDARAVIPAYAGAIADFLTFTNCRGVVATRDFSSPDTTRFTRCRILRLSHKQQLTLIRRADLPLPIDRATRDGLARASQDVATFAGNPMFLGLLCEHMRTASEFPTSSHTVFEDYLTHRLHRDADRIRARFGVAVEFVRAGAERIAYTMTATARMGLEPTRSALLAAVSDHDLSPNSLNKILDVLEYTRLGRTRTTSRGEVTFSFIHRRFQEYFATCMVIKDRTPLGVTDLLDVDAWRETAVTLLQVQEDGATRQLLTEATTRLDRYATDLDEEGFRWPADCRHLLGILAAGLESKPEAIPAELRSQAGEPLARAWDDGHRLDRRRALDYVVLAEPELAERMLVEAFTADNKYLRQAAFQAAGRLRTISAPLRAQIRRTLLGLAANLRSTFRPGTITTEVRRLREPAEYLSLVRFLAVAAPVAYLLPAAIVAACIWSLKVEPTALTPAWTQVAGFGLLTAMFAACTTGCVYLQLCGRVPLYVTKVWHRVLLVSAAAINAIMCVAIGLANRAPWTEPAAVKPILLVVCGYAVIVPLSVSWAVLTDHTLRPVLLPVLPIVLLTALLTGRARFPLPPPVRRRTPASRRGNHQWLVDQLGALVLLLLIALAILSLVLENRVPAVGIVLALGLIVAMIAWWSSLFGLALRRRAHLATTADEVLDVFARASASSTLSILVARFNARRVTADPAVRGAVETLVGEMERAKWTSPAAPVRLACPSLAARPVRRYRLLDTFLLRELTTFYASEIDEATLDDMARLAELE